MKKSKFVFLLIPFLLSSCGGGEKPPFDDDGMFGDDNDDVTIPELKDDTSSNYTFDESVKNTGGTTYEIFVRSFYDSNGDGIGDLNGVSEKLDYLADLGVNNIWLMPFNESPSYHGYDVQDYYSIEKDYGTLDDFKSLTEKAHNLGINIYMDLVINHSSDQNQWFIDSAKDFYSKNTEEGSKKDWYVWKMNSSSGYHEYRKNGMSGIYYEGQFSSAMPDFNLDNQEVRDELANVIKYWLDLGVDGFRLDAVLYYYYGSVTENIEFLDWIKNTAESVKKDTYIVGEAWTNWSIIQQYYKSTVDSFFNFPSSLDGYGNDAINGVVKSLVDANKFGDSIETKEKQMKTANPNGRSSYFLANHDMDRSSINLTGDYAKAAASLMMLLPGNPYVYYGEEIGLKGQRKSSSTDSERRLPMIWSESDKTGECEIPDKETLDREGIKIDQVKEGADDLIKEDYSLVNHYKKAINLRNKYSFIQDANFENLTENISKDDSHVLLYKLTNGDDSIIVAHNFNEKAREVEIGDISAKILDSINTTKKIPELNNGKLALGGYSTAILDVK